MGINLGIKCLQTESLVTFSCGQLSTRYSWENRMYTFIENTVDITHFSSAACISNMNLRVLQVMWVRDKLGGWTIQSSIFFRPAGDFALIMQCSLSFQTYSKFNKVVAINLSSDKKFLERNSENRKRKFWKLYQTFQERGD